MRWPWEPATPRQADSFQAFDLKRNPGMREAYEAAKAVAEGERSLAFLVGASGLGKTHLAIAAANAWPSCSRFAKVRDLLNVMREVVGANRDALRAAQEFYGRCMADHEQRDHLLVLDDLGAHYDTVWARDALFGLIDWRIDEELPTVVTSNASEGEFDVALVSRLRGGLVVCHGANQWGLGG